MAKVYSPPKELPVPVPDYMKPGRGWMEDERKWKESLRQYCVANGGKDEAVGTVIGFPVAADGKFPILLQLPMWQYSAEKTPRILQEIADRINAKGVTTHEV